MMTTPSISLMREVHLRPRPFWPVGLLVTLTAGAAGYLTLLWPWMIGWGATKAEQAKPLPGDDLVPQANLQTTKGVTIKASPDKIYPWLLQIGVDRGGMYSYDWLENLFGLKVHSVDRIVPEYQNVQVGDFWRFTPKEFVLNPGPGLYVRELQPNRAVLLSFGLENKPDDTCIDTWQFVLEPQADGSTRLLLRSRMNMKPELPIKLTYFIQFIMERKMLLEIRKRAERLALIR
ncbi:MAG: hypothetical protein KJ063_12570 [Anaerolineae bacterium]|nr:hypothetical protein [Anaerolineae bacterium]